MSKITNLRISNSAILIYTYIAMVLLLGDLGLNIYIKNILGIITDVLVVPAIYLFTIAVKYKKYGRAKIFQTVFGVYLIYRITNIIWNFISNDYNITASIFLIIIVVYQLCYFALSTIYIANSLKVKHIENNVRNLEENMTQTEE